jgi:predicted DNA-binding transcriptional regulator AlpA
MFVHFVTQECTHMKEQRDIDRRLVGLEAAIAYSPYQLAHVGGISLSLLWKLWREGKGPKYARLGTRRVIPRSIAEEWLRQRAEELAADKSIVPDKKGRACAKATA